MKSHTHHCRSGEGRLSAASRLLLRPRETPTRPARWRAARGVGVSGLLLSATLFLLMSSGASSAAAPTKRVLIVTSYDSNRPAIQLLTQAVRSTIRDGSPGHVEFFYEFQENSRIPLDKYEAETVSYLRRKYEGERFDLVIALGGPALNFLQRHESELFPGAPKIFYFHDEREGSVQSLWPRLTGVWANIDASSTLDVALALQPETRRVVVISGSSAQDRVILAHALEALRRYEGRLDFTYLSDLTIEELKERLAALPEKCVVLYLSFFSDSAGNSYSGPEALAMFAPASSAPVYGISETYMGK